MTSIYEPGKMTNGLLLSLLAGFFVLLNGVLWFAIFGFLGMMSDEISIMSMFNFTGVFWIFGVLGVFSAIAIFIGFTLVYQFRKVYAGGIVILVFSALSLGTGGGMAIGFILGIVGGALILKNR